MCVCVCMHVCIEHSFYSKYSMLDTYTHKNGLLVIVVFCLCVHMSLIFSCVESVVQGVKNENCCLCQCREPKLHLNLLSLRCVC